jgi:hypothetical protein
MRDAWTQLSQCLCLLLVVALAALGLVIYGGPYVLAVRGD